MSYFDTTKETYILVDASPVGLSAILTQKDPQQDAYNTIAHASRALSPVEKTILADGEGSPSNCLGNRALPSLCFCPPPLHLNNRSQAITANL